MESHHVSKPRGAWLGFLLLSLHAAFALADSPRSAEQVLRDFDSVLRSYPLPPLTTVLPRYQPAQIELPGLIVGYFETDSDDGLHWGTAFGEVLRHMVARSPGFWRMSLGSAVVASGRIVSILTFPWARYSAARAVCKCWVSVTGSARP